MVKKALEPVLTKLNELFTFDGTKQLKIFCYCNLDMQAKDEDDADTLNKFFVTAKAEGWLIKFTAKYEKDIIQHFRTKRNYL